jgi:predicted GIY-YIG superfamily endonuclease
MARKTVSFTKSGIDGLPDNKPAVYRVQTESGKTNYVGVAKRGRVQERLAEHLSGGKEYVPGAKVRVEQAKSIEWARQAEARVIARSNPRYNKQGKTK